MRADSITSVLCVLLSIYDFYRSRCLEADLARFPEIGRCCSGAVLLSEPPAAPDSLSTASLQPT